MSDTDVLGLRGKVAVIFGGGQGMGESTAVLFAKAGAHVATVDVDRERAERVANRVKEFGVKSMAIVADCLKYDTAEGVLEQVTKELGAPDKMVTIVGQALFKPALDIDEEGWDLDIRRNVGYVFFASKAFANSCIKHKKGGAIACVASVDGFIGAPAHSVYGVAKAGLVHLVKSLAVEWADLGIRVNAVAPGSIVTPRIPDTEEARQVMKNSPIPLARSGQTDEIAGPLVYLCSDLASYVTGHTMPSDGGWLVSNYFNALKSNTGIRYSKT